MVKHSIFHFHIRLIINMRSSVVTLDISQSQPHLPNANDYFTLPFFFLHDVSINQIILSINQNIFTKFFSRSNKIFSQKFSLDQPKYFHKNFPDQPKCFPVYFFFVPFYLFQRD